MEGEIEETLKNNLGLKTSPALKASCDKSNPLIKGESPPWHDLRLRTEK